MDEKKQHPNPSELPEDLSVPQEMPALDPGVLPDEENNFFTAPAELFDEEPAAAEPLPEAEELPAAEILPEVTESEPAALPLSDAQEISEIFETAEAEVIPEVFEAAETEEIPEVFEAAETEEIPVIPETAEAEQIPEVFEAAETEELPPVFEAPEEIPSPRNVNAFFIPDEEFAEPVPEETAPVMDPNGAEAMEDTQLYIPEDFSTSSEAIPPMEDTFPGTPEEQEAFESTLEAIAGEQTADQAPPDRKRRPKRKKGEGLFGLPHLAATVIWLAIVVAIGVSLGKVIWVCAADVLAFGRPNSIVTVTIVESDNIDTIAAKLHEAGLVNYPQLFKLYAQITDAEAEITTGSFQLNTNYDYHALVNGLSPSSSNRSVIEILIPEGYNCRQIFQLLEENNVCSVAALEEYAANGEFADFWFLEDVERGDKYCLEGYLFPDTYEFYVGSTPREALGKMLTGFDNRFTEELQEQLPGLNEHLSAMMRSNGCSEEYIAAHQLTIRDVLIVASLIEEETASSLESPTIASVIYNRLTQDQEYERYLGIDAALIYVTGSASNIDTSLDSPYNTYINAGLTPGPITNPGLASIEAALNPADTGYYYYVLNPETGTHQFSKTLQEHENWIEQFRSEDEE